MEILKKKEFWLSAILLLLCSLLGKFISGFPGATVIGHLVIALILGMLLQLSETLKKVAKGASGFISNKFLRLGIILMGFRLNLMVLAEKGVKTIFLSVIIVCFTIALIYYVAKAFGVEKKLALLSACGCGICGAAAVLAVSPIIKTDEDDDVISVAVVAILGTLFTLLLVAIRPMLPLTEVQYGVLAGGSLHEIAHAIAAGASGGDVALEMATIVKLSRVLILAPLSIILSLVVARKSNSGEKVKIAIPWFMLGFLVSSAIGTYVGIPESVINGLVDLAYILLGMAMAALGVNVNFSVVLSKGRKIFGVCFAGSAVLLGLVFAIAKMFF